jgi:hypothetical protein
MMFKKVEELLFLRSISDMILRKVQQYYGKQTFQSGSWRVAITLKNADVNGISIVDDRFNFKDDARTAESWAYHGGCPVLEGEKWSKFVYGSNTGNSVGLFL